jgi:hypothetical protein
LSAAAAGVDDAVAGGDGPVRALERSRQEGSLWTMNAGGSQAATADRTVSPGVVKLATDAVREFHGCFWWWNPEFIPKTEEDVREIVRHLRRGDHKAWKRAQELNACL